jgi:hypothetical protein
MTSRCALCIASLAMIFVDRPVLFSIDSGKLCSARKTVTMMH